MRLEELILSNLLTNEQYARSVLPHLKLEYFHDPIDEKLFSIIDNYVQTYNKLPNKEVLKVELGSTSGLSDDQYKSSIEILKTLSPDKSDEAWLRDETEKFCQDKAIYNAIRESIKILDDKNSSKSKGMIPELLSNALGISFDSHIGHSWADDAEARYEFYHRKEERLPFDIDFFNKVTQGGIPRKTLTILMASTGVGKSLMMCHMATANYLAGKNVLYITLELSEEMISERLDANILDISLDQLRDLSKDTYLKKIDFVKSKLKNQIIVHEYPTSSAGAANFRFLLNELKIKKNFIPDVIYVDYLSNCISSRYKNFSAQNSYTIGKAVAEELRGLAVEFNVPLITAMQTNRSGYATSDIDLTATSESMGVPFTADIMWAVIATEELLALNQYMIKQLKNRFSDINRNTRFVVGVDKMKMRLFNVDEPTKDLHQEVPPEPISKPTNKFDKSKFQGFK